ncbi:MAG TPA: leucine--tRNA ligase [Elusimicrobiales bacterium]|nr:leucine--tRNA ligase [Elusimicrobiales bacterium]
MKTQEINFKEIETKHQNRWYSSNLFKASKIPAKPKFYCLDMFPYPSGDGLHVGHPEGYTATDIISRYKRMKGYEVLHPMGWDAFGLPAENYAMANQIHPSVITERNINNFRRQIKSLGFSYDFEREINTTDPHYYKWTQWIFLKLYEKGLAYMDLIPINWCPKCKTGLANEEVFQGKCERCQTTVEKKNLRQWILKITAYAERLLKDLDQLDWPKSTIEMQKNWIGKSEGAEIYFPVKGFDEKIKVFTTRPDTIYGATYLVIAPEHPIAEKITTEEKKNEVKKYIEKALTETESERTESKEKTGVFTGAYAVNPFTKKEIPIFVSDYVLITYGTGAIMAVPAHDERDFEFAKKFNLEIKWVIKPINGELNKEKAFTEEGITINSPLIENLPTKEAKEKMINEIEKMGLGNRKVNYKLRDWIFSRQRYWGEPIPIVHCEKCGIVPLSEKDLPLLLPPLEKYEPSGTGESPLALAADWVNTSCPKCGGKARRETNTMPQWAGSCWYYLRYIDPKNDKFIIDPEIEKKWMPVDLYVGGAEHAVLHLLYARFWHKFLYDIGVVSTEEPFKKLIHQGMILSYSYRDSKGVYRNYKELDFQPDGTAVTEDGEKIKPMVEKMSKSKKNVINPDEIIEKYGADTFRMYEMFMGPLEDSKPWDMQAIEGVHRFIKRVWTWGIETYKELEEKDETKEIIILRNETIKKVGEDIEKMRFNTAISQLMIYFNEISKTKSKKDFEILIKLLHPFAPHITEELWEIYGKKDFIMNEPWPEYDSSVITEKTVEIAIQINGKLKGKIKCKLGTDEGEVKETAKKEVQKHLIGEIVKTIYVKDRLVNFVIKGGK